MALTQKERSAKSYKNKRDNGLCPRCGNVLDRKGYYCSSCLEKVNQYHRDNRRFYIENGICPVCGKEKLYGDEKQCISCRQKAYERKKSSTNEQKNRYREHFREQQKSLYKERSEKGICTRCGKRKADEGKKKCRICLNKDSEIHRKRTFGEKSIREYRKENHLCYYCGNEIDRKAGQICQSCFEICVKNGLKSGGGNSYWENDNKIVFNNKKNRSDFHERNCTD